MSIRARTTSFAVAGALAIAVASSGGAFAADLARDAGSSSSAFVDADGNGVDDACQQAVVADPVAAAAAEAAVDSNADGTISIDEAAHSDRVGGMNCNHGGYVSGVARAQCDGAEAGDATDATDATDQDTDDAQGADGADGALATLTTAEVAPDSGDASTDPTSGDCVDASAPTTAEAPTAPCVVVAPPTFDPTADTSPGAFGRYVASVAASDAVGGKNCNHGGAVSEAVHAAQAAAKAARDAAKAERAAARDAAKALRASIRAGKSHGHGHGHSH